MLIQLSPKQIPMIPFQKYCTVGLRLPWINFSSFKLTWLIITLKYSLKEQIYVLSIHYQKIYSQYTLNLKKAFFSPSHTSSNFATYIAYVISTTIIIEFIFPIVNYSSFKFFSNWRCFFHSVQFQWTRCGL